jgi:hypothetical protein
VYILCDAEPESLGVRLGVGAAADVHLAAVTSRGTFAWPAGSARIDSVGWWCARFTAAVSNATVTDAEILGLLGRIGDRYRWMDVQKLTTFGSEEGFTRAQGE